MDVVDQEGLLASAEEALCLAISVLMRPGIDFTDGEFHEARMACLRVQDALASRAGKKFSVG